ncbi:hypothetical protein BTA51_06195 [Hahella sp. CCB-MM4]|uniref:sensor histidine kinase n=1 Tax=Hahella sp. (strain CCB-MM4) TaxID=1926491 RepID=UPI000B9C3C95|nr:sensor histidine kinase [Hahella sp. CCB-MM4]OZG74586.1 hypothetical protein BTA51_06195 [Hahella sp. CCB-MM4]
MLTTDTILFSSPHSGSLHRQLIIRMFLLLMVTLLVLGIGVWIYAQRASDLSHDRLLTGAGLAILDSVREQSGRIEVDIPYAAMGILALARDDKVYYRITGPGGRYLTGYPDLPVRDVETHTGTPVFYNAEYKGESVRIALQEKFLTEQNVRGWVTVAVAQTTQARTELFREIMLGALGILSLVILLALAGTWVAISRALGPLYAIRREIQRREPTDLTPLTIETPDEVTPLVETINMFMRRLQENLDTIKMFIANAAHQIRTSLSTVQAQINLAQHDQTLEQLSQRIMKINDGHQRLNRLTNQLLTHALVTHRADTFQPESIHLTGLLQDILVQTVRDHAHTSVEFGFHNEAGDITIAGDTISLREAVNNLLHNAIKYGPENNQVTIQLQPGRVPENVPADDDRQWVEIWVDDEGPGIPKDFQLEALKRFSRLGEKQAQEHQVLGSGLGLAIACAVLEAHEGRIVLENLHPVGLRVRLCLPVK